MFNHLAVIKDMNKKNTYRGYLLLPILALLIFAAGSCRKYLPKDREEVGADSRFTQIIYEPVLGRNNLFSNNFFKGSTSFPVTFKIINPRRFNGDPAPELTDTFPVTVWKEAYTGKETSIAEIEAKRGAEYHALWEVGPHSGEFLLWAKAKAAFMHPQPDSGYIFDVEMSNSGGRRYFRDLKLRPFRERPFEPSNLDPITGQATNVGIHPSLVQNVQGAETGRYLYSGDVDVFFHRIGDGHKLTFMFLDTLYRPINPDKFNLTEWGPLVHGFNMAKTDTSVSYDVAYPIPLTNLRTKYTTQDGTKAHVNFSYSRLGFGHIREVANVGLDFSIYEPGDWVIIFAFKTENPKFKDD